MAEAVNTTVRVRSRTTWLHYLSMGGKLAEELEEKRIKTEYTGYDEAGRVTGHITYQPDGGEEEVQKFEYNDNGFMVAEEREVPGDDFTDRTTYEVDEQGRRVTERKHYLDGSLDITEYKYDEKGLLNEKQTHDFDGMQEARVTFGYENELLVEKKTYDEDDELVSRTVIRYDENGNLIENIVYDSDEEMMQRVADTYEENKLVKSVVETEGEVIEIYYQYNDSGKVIEEKQLDEDGEITRLSRNTYNDRGMLISQESEVRNVGMATDQEFVSRFEYEFYE